MKRTVKPDDVVKTTIRLPRPLWDLARHRAIDENTDLQELVARALADYLKKGGSHAR